MSNILAHEYKVLEKGTKWGGGGVYTKRFPDVEQ